MLTWFEKKAPIRSKFKALLAINTVLGSTGVVTTWMAGGNFQQMMAVSIAFAFLILTTLIAARCICTPYVNTVVRMEALAAGDTRSPIAYTEYKDCVGRMTKAMATFRDNAVEIARAREAQAVVVQEISGGLSHLMNGNFEHRITTPFALEYEELRGTFNQAINKLREADEKEQTREAQNLVVQSISGGLKQMADGNLAHRIATPFAADYEELRRTYNQTMDTLADLMERVASSADSVSTGASEICTASNDFALRNEQQAASLEETSAAMNQVTDTVRITAEGASEVQRNIKDAHREAAEGGMVVQRATEAMAMIEKSAQEITQIINVIDGIAFQTNLLALNAGVEAARAGDAGKGFAVVANEVRALAQRAAEAAKDIKELITASTRQVEGGVELVSETGSLLGKIVARVGDISELITRISESASSQALRLEQVNAAVGEMDKMTQQNAAMVEQSNAAARSLASEAEDLNGMVARFQTGSTGVVRKLPTSKTQKPVMAGMPLMSGNLALKSTGDGEGWNEF